MRVRSRGREYHERGATLLFADHLAARGVQLELLAGDATAAIALGEEGCKLLEAARQWGALSTAAEHLAQALYAADRLDEADAWANRGAELGAADDATTQFLWRQVHAKVLARRGEHPAAQRLAREAVAIAEDTDMLKAQADAYADLAEVLSLAGDSAGSAVALSEALDRYEQKEIVPLAHRVRERLNALQDKAG